MSVGSKFLWARRLVIYSLMIQRHWKVFFRSFPSLIAAHCEDESTIRNNSAEFKQRYGEDVPIECHPQIRSVDACFKSSSFAIGLAKKHGTRFHVLHISTAKETSLFDNNIPLAKKKITVRSVYTSHVVQ